MGRTNGVRVFAGLAVVLLAGCSRAPLTARPEYCQEQPATSPVTVQGPTAAELARCGAVPRGPGEDIYGFVIDGACRYVVHVPSQCGPGRCTLRMVAMDGSASWSGPCSAVKAGDFIFDVTSRDGRRGVFMMSYTRPDAALDIADGKEWISGRIGLLGAR